MSKHSKALRRLAFYSSPGDKTTLEDAADHMESLERQLRIAKRALMAIQYPELLRPWETAQEALAAMRQAKKGSNLRGDSDGR